MSRMSKTGRQTKLHYGALESRQLLAGVSLETINGLNTVLIDGSNGSDTVEVTMDDGNLSVDFNGQLHTIQSDTEVERIRFLGRSGHDTFINQTDISSAIFGHNGNDVLHGGNGNNWIQGGNGNDQLFGGDRNDLIRGRAGNDYIDAGKRHDRVFAGGGNDTVIAGAGHDLVNGDAGNDTIWGGQGEDRINGGYGHNTLQFGTGTPGTVIFDDVFASYEVDFEGNNQFQVSSSLGSDLIYDVGSFRFTDGVIEAGELALDLSGVEQESARALNEARVSRGLSELTLKVDIVQYAQDRAETVLAGLGPNPTSSELFAAHSTFEDIMHLANGNRTLYLENLAFIPSEDLTDVQVADRIVQTFIDSPTHRANLLNSDTTELGIGIFKNSHGWYVVNNFFVT